MDKPLYAIGTINAHPGRNTPTAAILYSSTPRFRGWRKSCLVLGTPHLLLWYYTHNAFGLYLDDIKRVAMWHNLLTFNVLGVCEGIDERWAAVLFPQSSLSTGIQYVGERHWLDSMLTCYGCRLTATRSSTWYTIHSGSYLMRCCLNVVAETGYKIQSICINVRSKWFISLPTSSQGKIHRTQNS